MNFVQSSDSKDGTGQIHKHTLRINNVTTLEYYHLPRKRVKTSEIIVGDDNEVIVRTPFNKPCIEVQNLMKTKRHWILKKKKEFLDQKDKIEIIAPKFVQDSTLPYLGKNLLIEIIDSNGTNEIQLMDNTFLFNINSNGKQENIAKIESLYQNWIKAQAEKIFIKKVFEFRKKMKVRPEKVAVKKLRNRWGSLTRTGTINLNFNLIKAPVDVVDYIIIHELCHFKIKEHSHHFWHLLAQYIPNYDEKIKWLQINGRNMI